MQDRTKTFRQQFERVSKEVQKRIVGYEDLIEKVLICLFARGHVLLEGVPGLGKTLLVRTLADALSLRFSRIQFTPDLMPADITGTTIMAESENGERDFSFRQGPVFANIVLADEINRATPKTQSALLEAMQELTVTAGGTTHALETPFFVLGTQNPIEMEGTYPLPEAQVDRFFFKLQIEFVEEDHLVEVIDRTTAAREPKVSAVLGRKEIHEMQETVRHIAAADHVKRYAIRTVMGTHPGRDGSPDIVRRYVRYGASPRGIQALILGGKIKAILEGRFNVSEEDIRYAAVPALRHRVILSFEGEAEEISPDQIIEAVLE
ncbi:MAG: AAA family ATPase [Planctomycetota bacterium]|nr:AAA family ATPase [Planctomycetota bacterium]